MPTLSELLNGMRPQQTMGLSDILAMLTGSGSAQAAQPEWTVRGGLDTRVNSGQLGAAPQAPTGPSTARDPVAQKAAQLEQLLIQRGIPPAQARAMALQQIQTR